MSAPVPAATKPEPARVAFVVHTFAPVRGGCETLVEELARARSAAGDRVRVLTSNATSTEGFVRPSEPRLPAGPDSVRGVAVERLRFRAGPLPVRRMADAVMVAFERARWPGYGTVKTLWVGPHLAGLERALERFGPDVVVAGAFPFRHTVRTGAWCRANGRPLVLLPATHPLDAWAFQNPRLDRELARADGVIALTEAERDHLVAAGVDRDRVAVLGVGVHAPPADPLPRAAARRELGLPAEAGVVLFLGRLDEGKGVADLLRAHERLTRAGSDSLLLFAGASTAWSREILAEREVRTAGSRVRLLGEVDEATKSQLLAAADVLALPSIVDSFGVVLLEAWSFGLPVVAARTAALSSVVDDGVDGLLAAPGDDSELAAALASLLADPDRARALGRAGREKTRRRFAWPAVAERFERLLARVRRRPAGAAGAAAPQPRPDVSVVVVAHDGGSDLDAAVASALDSLAPADEVIVVDNASRDDSIAALRHARPAARILELSGNKGFAGGANRGLRLARGELVVLLNQDAHLTPDALRHLREAARAWPEAGVLVPKVLVREEPDVVQSAGLVANRSLYAADRGHLELDGPPWDRSEAVIGGSGAALALRREMLDAVGELDDRLFMYYEDFDLCLRALGAGWEVRYVPAARVLHRQRAVARGARLDERIDHRNRLRVALKLLPGRALATFLAREVPFQLRALATFAVSGRWSRLGHRLAGLGATLAGLPSTLRERRRLLGRADADARRWLARLDDDWGYPRLVPPAASLGERRPAVALDFSPGGASSFGLGWWPPEHDPAAGWFRWTGAYGIAYLVLPPSGSEVKLSLRSLVERRVTLTIGGQAAGEIVVTPGAWRELRLAAPSGAAGPQRALIVPDACACPSGAGSGGDRRRLGVACSRLEVAETAA